MSNTLNPEDVEKSVLGSIFLDNALISDARDVLMPEHFSTTWNEQVFAAMCRANDRREPIDAAVMMSCHPAVPATYMAGLTDAALSGRSFASQVRVIRERATLRDLVKEARNLVMRAEEQATLEDVESFVSEAGKRITAICERSTGDGRTAHVGDILRRVLDDIEAREKRGDRMDGLSTGFRSLDDQLGGMGAGHLIVLAARPAIGKTALAMNIAANVTAAGTPALVFSLEMSDRQLITRLLSARSGVQLSRLLRGDMAEWHWKDTMEAANHASTEKLWIDDRSNLTPEQIVATARTAKRQHGIGLIVIDYLQLIHVRGGKVRDINREREVSEISRSLKWLARELSVPVLALAQLNRELERRPNKRPMLADLRDSGSIEQDADVVAFIYRDEVYDPSPTLADRGLAEVIFAKHRHGSVGTRCLEWHPEVMRFAETNRTPARAQVKS